MPEIPSIIPLILTGVFFGSVLRKTNVGISWKLISPGILVGGLGNLAHAAALLFFQGQGVRPTATQPALTNLQLPSTSQTTFNPVSFFLTSFIVGAIMVLVILATTILTLRLRGRIVVEE